MRPEARMRILLVLDDERDLSGPSIVLLRLFSALQERDLVEIHVLTQRSSRILATLEKNRLTHTIHSFPITYSRENLAALAWTSSMRKAKLRLVIDTAKNFRADIVHLAVHPLGPLVVPALAKIGLPCFVHFHANHGYPRITPYRYIYKRCLSHPNAHAITVSDWITNNVLAMGIPQEKITRIYNGLTATNLRLHKGESTAQKPVLAFIAQIRPEKGLLHFISALRHVALKLPQDYTFPITGAIIGHSFDADHIAKCQKYAKECENETRGRVAFEFLGRSQEPFDIFKTLAAVVVPSLFDDPLPTVAVEAVCRGLPTIGYARGGLLEILHDGRGHLVPANDVQALSEAIHTVLTNEDWKRREVVHSSATSVFSMDAMVETYLTLAQAKLHK